MTDNVTESTLNGWLKGVTHRPDWVIKYAGNVDGDHYVTVRATEVDTVTGGVFVTSPLFRVPAEMCTAAQFYDWLLDVCIPGIDTHERWEWFRVGGVKWRDPHAPGMPAFATDFPAATA
jgi:hypothetical protein